MSDLNKKILYIIGYTLLVVAVTHFATPTKVRIETKTVEVTKEVEAVQTHSQTTETIKPDGTKTTTTVVDTNSHTTTKDSLNTSTDSSQETTYDKSGITIQGLAALDITNPSKGFIFGASVSKPFIGPIVIGVFGFTDGRVGISAGLKF